MYSNQFISGVNCFRYLLNKTVDIKFSAHDTFREYPSSGRAQYRNIGMPNNVEVFRGN